MKKHVGLSSKKCMPCEAGKVKALSEAEVNSYRNQVQGWRLVSNSKGDQCLRQDWKVRNFKAGLEAFSRIGEIAEEEGHHPDLHLEGYNGLAAELSTHSVGAYIFECLLAVLITSFSGCRARILTCVILCRWTY